MPGFAGNKTGPVSGSLGGLQRDSHRWPLHTSALGRCAKIEVNTHASRRLRLFHARSNCAGPCPHRAPLEGGGARGAEHAGMHVCVCVVLWPLHVMVPLTHLTDGNLMFRQITCHCQRGNGGRAGPSPPPFLLSSEAVGGWACSLPSGPLLQMPGHLPLLPRALLHQAGPYRDLAKTQRASLEKSKLLSPARGGAVTGRSPLLRGPPHQPGLLLQPQNGRAPPTPTTFLSTGEAAAVCWG